jgi:hypothetical protein
MTDRVRDPEAVSAPGRRIAGRLPFLLVTALALVFAAFRVSVGLTASTPTFASAASIWLLFSRWCFSRCLRHGRLATACPGTTRALR